MGNKQIKHLQNMQVKFLIKMIISVSNPERILESDI